MMGCVTSNKGLSCGDDPDYDRIRDFLTEFYGKRTVKLVILEEFERENQLRKRRSALSECY